MIYTNPETTTTDYAGGKITHVNHDAFGMVGLSIVTGGSEVLFGSDLKHGQHIRLSIKRATQQRNLSRDWYLAGDELIEVCLSQHQFAELITSPNRGEGVPCTILRAPEKNTKIVSVPGILPLETKAEIMRNEIKESAHEQMQKISGSLEKLEKLIEEGGVGKKALKQAIFNLKCDVENTQSNMAFVVEQSEKALKKAVTSAKIDVEAYINSAIHKLGIEAANNIGLTSSSVQGLLINE